MTSQDLVSLSGSLDPLRAHFNARAGSSRLLAFVSPT